MRFFVEIKEVTDIKSIIPKFQNEMRRVEFLTVCAVIVTFPCGNSIPACQSFWNPKPFFKKVLVAEGTRSLSQSLFNVCNEIVGILKTYREADEVGGDACGGKLLVGHLTVGG